METPAVVRRYVDEIRSGSRATLGRAITLVESEHPNDEALAHALLKELAPLSQDTLRLGVSGAPGVGKSTFIDAFGSLLVDKGHRVAVLATDPSSVRSGGSILGDKTRMGRLSHHPNAFIRPSPNRGILGGVAPRTQEGMLLCEHAGFDIIIVETVGVGQSEITVTELVDISVVLTIPSAGDELQGLKRGILEVTDLLIVHKADGPLAKQAESARATYERAFKVLHSNREETPLVFTCSSLENRGIEDVWQHIKQKHDNQKNSGEHPRRRQEQLVRTLWHLLERRFLAEFHRRPDLAALATTLESSIRTGETSAREAADDLWKCLMENASARG